MILKMDSCRPDLKKLKFAADTIIRGGLVAFPTETVYGLGANALNPAACKKIFSVKNRPHNDPLIIHIADKKELVKLVKNVPLKAEKLINKFWPGPLTLVFYKSSAVPDIVTAGLKTVAIRVPKNKIALSLLKLAKVPVAAPSANKFSRVSATTAEDVAEELGDKADVIIDGGKTDIGVESTILDVTREPFTLLRPGGISVEKIEKVAGKIKVNKTSGVPVAPGMFPRHYAPESKVIVINKSGNQLFEIKRAIEKYKNKKVKLGVVVTSDKNMKFPGCLTERIIPDKNHKEFAYRLYDILRSMDKRNIDIIIVQGIDNKGLGLAVMDRLAKASSYK